jgi:Tol biopolymer transport system component
MRPRRKRFGRRALGLTAPSLAPLAALSKPKAIAAFSCLAVSLGVSACQAPKPDTPPPTPSVIDPIGAGPDASPMRGPLAETDPDAASTSPPSLQGVGPGPNSANCLPGGPAIVFVSLRAPGMIPSFWELFSMAPDGGGVKRLTNGGDFRGPAYSPDGTSIAFQRLSRAAHGGTLRELGLMSKDGSQAVVLASQLGSGSESFTQKRDAPTWSPDGQTLAYAMDDPAGAWRIWRIARSGAKPQPLLPDFAGSHFSPSWSRTDPAQLAFVGESNGVLDIWLVDPENPRSPANLTGGAWPALESPRWSPDGKHLVFTSSATADAGAPASDLFVVTTETLEVTRITADAARDIHPAWSPDGQSLVFSSSRAYAMMPDQRQRLDIWSLPLGSPRDARRLTTLADNLSPDWSANGACGNAGLD